MAIDWQPLVEMIGAHERFVLSSHVRPDADAMGSELAMAGFLAQLGKSAQIINPSAAPDTLNFLDNNNRIKKLGDGAKEKDILNAEVHIILDTSAWVQLQEVGRVFRKSDAIKVVIDHHASADALNAYEFKDTTRDSTGSLVFEFAQYAGFEITPEIARYLFCAIATDTGWFRFSSTNGNTLRTAAALIDAGARPADLYRDLYEQRSLARVKLSGQVLSRIQQSCGGRIAFLEVSMKDFDNTGARPVDTEDLVNESLRIARTEAAFIAVEQQNGQIKFSLRSRGKVNVAKVAEQFGGGGHKQASGAILDGPLSLATKNMLAEFHSAMGCGSNS